MKKKPAAPVQGQPVKKKKRRVWVYVVGALLVIGVVGNLVNPNPDGTLATASPSPGGAGRVEIVSQAVSSPAAASKLTPSPEPTPTPSPTPAPTPTPEPTPATPTEEPVVYVWIPQSGSKYHSRASCSGMDNPQKVTLEEAQAMGYTACKRCY